MVGERLNQLCLSMAGDPGLRAMLADAGVTVGQWEALFTAVRDGTDVEALTPLLDAVDEAAAAAGIDGVTTGDRRFQPLPEAAGFRTAYGWLCPHPHPCGRVQPSDHGTPPMCPLTSDPLTPVAVVSG
jgi:hypothetical protein